MGILKVFKRKNDLASEAKKGIFMPITGKLLAITEVPDAVFSQKMMGDGFAVEPEEGKVYSPVSGKIVSVFPTKHAITMLADEGHELLIHFGMDTVALKGEGFTIHVKDGDHVGPEDLLMSVDLDAVGPKVPSLITPIIFMNLGEKSIELKKTGTIAHGTDDILEIK
jgi:PTS system D-glucosamine-specific IIC component